MSGDGAARARAERYAQAIFKSQDGWPIAWVDLHEDVQAGYVAEARVAIALADSELAELQAEVERLRALVGDEDQPGWDTCSRAEAIRQANEFHTDRLRWIDMHHARCVERDEAIARAEAALAGEGDKP